MELESRNTGRDRAEYTTFTHVKGQAHIGLNGIPASHFVCNSLIKLYGYLKKNASRPESFRDGITADCSGRAKS